MSVNPDSAIRLSHTLDMMSRKFPEGFFCVIEAFFGIDILEKSRYVSLAEQAPESPTSNFCQDSRNRWHSGSLGLLDILEKLQSFVLDCVISVLPDIFRESHPQRLFFQLGQRKSL